MKLNPLNLIDFYKTGHRPQYAPGTVKVVTNGTPRKSRIEGIEYVIFFGLQYYIKEYLINVWKREFFDKPIENIVKDYARRINNGLGTNEVNFDHIRALHKLQYLPLEIMALPEGAKVPIKVPPFVIWNTQPEFFWLVNYLETSLSASLWQMCTSATYAKEFRTIFDKWALKTVGNTAFCQFQGHDFSMRGMSSIETAAMSGAAHLTSFVGSDTVYAIDFLEEYYRSDSDKELIGCSVPATEHSVMCSAGKEDEIGTFKRLLDLYPSGILSVVSDTWDLWKVCTEYLPKLKDLIKLRGLYTHADGRTFIPYVEYDEDWKVIADGFRDNTDSGIEYSIEWVKNNPDITYLPGKLVIRPDSGDPVDILCGTVNYTNAFMGKGNSPEHYWKYSDPSTIKPSEKGVVELLWDVFGGTINEYGYKVLDPHIGCIYGDSINLKRAEEINRRLEAKRFASINWVAGIGSFTYQFNTRDTQGWALKATYVELLISGKIIEREIFKDPVTDDGTKKSAKGLIAVYQNDDGTYYLKDQVSWKEVYNCAFTTVFKDGQLLVDWSLESIRERIKNS